MSNPYMDVFGSLAVLAIFLWPLMMICAAGFTLWILVTITISIRGIRRELTRMNDHIERNGVVRVTGSSAGDVDIRRESAAEGGYTRTGPLNLAGTR